MSEAEIRRYPLSHGDDTTKRYVSNMPELLEITASLGDDVAAADSFCTHLAWEFGVAIRENIPGDNRSLKALSNWVYRE